MSINPELLKILVCPETHQSLSLCAQPLLVDINTKISAGKLKTKGGAIVKDALQAALIRQDGQVLYPIKDEIPVLLVDEGIYTA